MATKRYWIKITLLKSKSNEGDWVAEYYGNFMYHAEGESLWTTLAETNDSAPWKVLDSDTSISFSSGVANRQLAVVEQWIDVPSSSTVIDIKAQIKEYDPSAFDADEDLGTSIISMPLNESEERKESHQGNSNLGEVSWVVRVTPKAIQDAYGKPFYLP